MLKRFARSLRPVRLSPIVLEDRCNPSTFTVLNIDDDGGVNPSAVGVLDGTDNGTGTLRQAIVNANANPGADFIVFDAATFSSTQIIALASGLPALTGETTITGTVDGADVPLVTVSGEAIVPVFDTRAAAAGTLITFDKLIITKGNAGTAAIGGGLTVSDEVVTFSNGTISSSTADQGGGVRVTGAGTLNLINATILSNSSTFANTTTPTAGGGAGIRVTTNTVLNITGSTIKTNTANNDGGGIYGSGSTISITGSTLISNRTLATNITNATNGGGAVKVVGSSTLTINQSTIQANTSNNAGGAIYNSTSKVFVDNSLLISNKAVSSGSFTGRGGAIYGSNSATTLTITNSRLTGNSAGVIGGGLYGSSNAGANITITNTTLDSNTAAANGGGIVVFGGASFTLTNSTLSNNSAASSGGGIHAQNAVLNFLVSNSTIAQNTSGTAGGAVHFVSQAAATSTVFRNSTISKNVSNSTSTTAGAAAGGVSSAAGGVITLSSTILSGNTMAGGGQFSDFSINAAGSVTASFSAIGSKNGHTPVLTKSSTPTPGTNLDYGINLNLASLADNGGALQGPTGNTAVGKTIELIAGSPAINTGDNPAPALTTDARGGTFLRTVGSGTDIGSFERVPGAPIATADPFLTISESNFATQDPYIFTVKYFGDFNLDVSKLGDTDVRIKNSVTGFDEPALFVSSTPSSNSTALVVTYKIAAPVGGWTSAANGLYTVEVQPNEVFLESSTLAAPLTTVGAFLVTRDYIVTTDADSGAGSLRQAILDSNARSGPNTIRFDNTFTTAKTVMLADGVMTISEGLTIVGPGTNLFTLDAIGSARHFNISGATAAQIDVAISNMTLTGSSVAGTGLGGAIIFGDERLTLSDMWIHGNTSGNGGAIATSNNASLVTTPSLTLVRTALTGNVSANRGGAIFMYSNANSVLDIRNSTISGNSAVGVGGAFYGFNWNSSSHVLSVSNSTITNNTGSTGGGLRVSASATPVITLRSSVVAGNFGSSGPDILNGTVNSQNSAIGDATGTTYTPGTGDVAPGTPLELEPLGDNGGNSPTHALGATSPLLNAGTNLNNFTTDQRGGTFSRVVGAAADIGAFEVQSVAPTFPAVTSISVNDGAVGGSTQRSRITTITVTFAGNLSAGNITTLQTTDVIKLINAETGAGTVQVRTGGLGTTLDGTITVTATPGTNTAVLTFAGAAPAGPSDPRAVDFGSLSDGRWRLEIDSTPGGAPEYVSDGSVPAQRIRRLFGDINGDGTVDGGTDSASFAIGNFQNVIGLPPGTTTAAFDFNNDGTIDGGTDFAEFGSRFGRTV